MFVVPEVEHPVFSVGRFLVFHGVCHAILDLGAGT